MENDLISIIVPVYNVESYLERCVNSILKQTYRNLEILLIDDGSTDKSGNICDSFANIDDRVIVLHKENGGQSTARNLGIENANGKWISFVDSDDFVREDYISELYRLCIEYNVPISQCGAVRGLDNCFPKEVSQVREKKWKFIEMYKSKERAFRAIVWGKLIKANLVKKNLFPIGKIFEDEGMIFKCMYEGKECVSTNKHMYYYYMSDNSTIRNNNKSINFDFIDIFDDRINFLIDRNELELVNFTKKELLIRILLRYCVAKDLKQNINDIQRMMVIFNNHYNNINWKYDISKKEICAIRLFYYFPRIFAFFENNFKIIRKNKFRREKK